MDSDGCPVDPPLISIPTDSSLSDSVNAAGETTSLASAAPPSSELEDPDSDSLIQPPPLDWRSESSSGAEEDDEEDEEEEEVEEESSVSAEGSTLDKTSQDQSLDVRNVPTSIDVTQLEVTGEERKEPSEEEEREMEEEESSVLPSTRRLDKTSLDQPLDVRNIPTPLELKDTREEDRKEAVEEEEVERWENVKEEDNEEEEVTFGEVGSRHSDDEAAFSQGDEDHSSIHSLLTQLQLLGEDLPPGYPLPPPPPHLHDCPPEASSAADEDSSSETTGLLFSHRHQRDVQGLLQCSEIGAPPQQNSSSSLASRGAVDAVVSVSYSRDDAHRFWGRYGNGGEQQREREDSLSSLPDDEYPEPVWMKMGEEAPEEEEEERGGAEGEQTADDHPSYKDVPGPCDPEDLLDGVIFGAKYLGSTQIKSDKNPSTNARMTQAQEAVDRIKAPEGESQPMTEVDLFISTQRIKVLSADTQEAMMDHALQMISYIADIDNIVVLMARRKRKGQDADASSPSPKKCTMICHVFASEDAQVIAQAIGQAFGVAYQQFLQASGIRASDLKPGEYSDYLENQELYNGDLAHFSDSQNLRDISITKPPGEILGLAVVESGWGSILPTVVVANLLHGGPAERCGELSIGDRIMSVNGTSLVGLPINTCQNVIRDLKSQKYVKLSIVHCPPVTMAIIRRPDPKFQLGFSVEDGIICSLMRGGIAERGGIRVGHRIIEINGQSVVATPHEKIIQILTNAIGEIHLKTMPASTYRLLTGQEQPVFL